MKRTLITTILAVSVLICNAQTLNVVTGNITTQFPATQAGDMTYSDNGQTLTIMGKAFSVADIDNIYIDETQVTDSRVAVSYAGSNANITIAGNVAQHITIATDGAHVTIDQGDVSDEVTYALSGTSTDGEFYMTGSYKATIEFEGLTLTNPNGAAVNIQDGKRIDVSIKKDTENTLTDGSNGEQKACFVIKGHAEFKGKGTLNINGLTNHGIKTGEYMSVKNCTINIVKAVGDGIHVNEYFLMESGTIDIKEVGDDGIQTELDGTATTGETTDHEGEDSGNVYFLGGTLTAAITATAAKGIKAVGDITIGDGSITITASGDTDTSDSKDLKASACIKSDAAITISGGTLNLTHTGQGGRAMSADGKLTVTGGTTTAAAKGSNYGSSGGRPGGGGGWPGGGGSSSSHKYAKGVKADGAINISDGTLTISSANHEGLESKSTINISGGIVSVTAYDDAINSSGNFTISGGYVMGYATNNDGLDANGNFYIKGGVVYAIGAKTPEMAIDANTEQQKKLYVTGGTIVTIGPLEGGSSLTQTCYKASSYKTNTWYALYSGDDVVAIVKTPTSSSNLGSGMIVTTSGTVSLKSGVTVTGGTTCFSGMGNIGGTVTNGSSVSISKYTSSSGR